MDLVLALAWAVMGGTLPPKCAFRSMTAQCIHNCAEWRETMGKKSLDAGQMEQASRHACQNGTMKPPRVSARHSRGVA